MHKETKNMIKEMFKNLEERIQNEKKVQKSIRFTLIPFFIKINELDLCIKSMHCNAWGASVNLKEGSHIQKQEIINILKSLGTKTECSLYADEEGLSYFFKLNDLPINLTCDMGMCEVQITKEQTFVEATEAHYKTRLVYKLVGDCGENKNVVQN